MNENKHGSRKLTPAISLKYGQTGWHKPANRRSRPFSVTWPNLDLNVFTSQIEQSSEIKVIYLLVQFFPSPWYPSLQVQVNKGVVSVQIASLWQLCVFVAHSSIAKKQK